MTVCKHAGGATLILLLAAPLAQAGDMDAQMAALRAATAKYADVNVALANGYIQDPSGACITSAEEGLPPEWGAMGIHYLNMELLGVTAGEPRVDGNGTNIDFTQPSVLMYEPQADGSMELVAVENLVFQAGWAAAGNDAVPMFAEQVYNVMADDPSTDGDEAHRFEPHYDLHIWSERENPAGLFVPFNAAVSCENAS